MNSYRIVHTAQLGDLLLVADERHLTGIYFADKKHAPAIGEDWKQDARHAVLNQAAAELGEFLDGKRREFSVPVRASGTAYQQKIWRAIEAIPFGKTMTYSQLAEKTGSLRAVRAAGLATGKNPISIIVPCHRVVGKGGELRGYAGGLERKQCLLTLER